MTKAQEVLFTITIIPVPLTLMPSSSPSPSSLLTLRHHQHQHQHYHPHHHDYIIIMMITNRSLILTILTNHHFCQLLQYIIKRGFTPNDRTTAPLSRSSEELNYSRHDALRKLMEVLGLDSVSASLSVPGWI